MTCEFDYCIYNKKFTCILDEIEINNSGLCGSCILISLDDKALEKVKEKQLEKLFAPK